MICDKCGKEIADDMIYCGYCGLQTKGEKKSLVQDLADNADGLSILAERILKAFSDMHEKSSKKVLQISSVVLFLIALVTVLTYMLADQGKIDSGAFTFLMGTIIGALLTFLGDVAFSE